ncbi:MAG TPA: hypothetical protein VM936_09550 [Pyrinomonadaceae bacterium]|nr:hypothetical protein [Pyrinomonadaceae bacterium]
MCDLMGSLPAAHAQTGARRAVPVAVSAATLSGSVIVAKGVRINGVATDAVFVGGVGISDSYVLGAFPSGYDPVEGAFPSGYDPIEPANGAFPSGYDPVEGAFPSGYDPIEPVNGAFPSGIAPGDPVELQGAFPSGIISNGGDGLQVIGGTLEGTNIQVINGMITGDNLVLVGAYVTSSGAQ